MNGLILINFWGSHHLHQQAINKDYNCSGYLNRSPTAEGPILTNKVSQKLLHVALTCQWIASILMLLRDKPMVLASKGNIVLKKEDMKISQHFFFMRWTINHSLMGNASHVISFDKSFWLWNSWVFGCAMYCSQERKSFWHFH